ncbi:exodeoxyribonuclease V subunit beta [Xanthomonas albilineans]|uniref:exodeoxyribonuclease V subunit beta n=1 Tax=Xanthomonas albilineans TaxID=29447 RepID=UPI0005F303B5|nr:exodeoxyribonuclease V subunit beta [Xanthomonas albilineans]
MSTASDRDPYLHLPLHGVRLIEASAGTGKTFTLATLFTRLVVERGLRLGQILAVTFTEAATQELRRRIRERLTLAATLVPETDAAAWQMPASAESPDVSLTRQLLQAHLAAAQETPAALRRRLQQAAEDIDLAAIFTIHGFCARALREYALESGQPFATPQLLTDERELLRDVAADLWRAHAVDASVAEDLEALWKGGPHELAADLHALIHIPHLLPLPSAQASADPSATRAQAAQVLIAAMQTHADDAYAAIIAAFDNKVFNGKLVKRPSFDKAFEQLWQGRADAQWTLDAPGSHLDKLLPARLSTFCREDARDRVPRSPLFDAFDAWQQADAQVRQWQTERRIRFLHTLREAAIARIAAIKRQRRVQTYDDFIDAVAQALRGPHAEALARGLRAQYAVALVDEFQDTDARQWAIFSTLFGISDLTHGIGFEPGLFLIGDPKQAIYGFRGGDVHTYLSAVTNAERAPPLDHNFRSRPALLTAIDALYAQAGYTQAFFIDGIDFHPVQAGGRRADTDLQRDGRCAPALTLWRAPDPPLPAKGKPRPWSAGRARELCTAACIAAIGDWLGAGRAGNALVDGRAVQPGDIAVLVRSHSDATRIQQALAAVGIPAVAAGKQSLFASEEALELMALLHSLLDPGDDSRLRAALATVLIGEDAAAIAALDHDGERHRRWQQQALDWRERWQRGGPLALIEHLGSTNAQRLLALVDGERRLSNYLQLAELLQEAHTHALGPHGLVDWLARRIAASNANDDTQLLRLESDARRVQIITLHKSKGLEYPLVFLPYVGIGQKPLTQKPGERVIVHRQGKRCLHWPLHVDAVEWEASKRAWEHAQRAEDARLLYVGLTRAEHALWIATGPFFRHDTTALAPMLSDIDALQSRISTEILVCDNRPPPPHPPRLPPAEALHVPPARTPTRKLVAEWWVYSFTQLANADAGTDPMASTTVASRGGRDEPTAADTVNAAAEVEIIDRRFVGNRFGVAMHEVFERCDFAAWRDWRPGQPAPVGQHNAIVEALQRGGYAEDELTDGSALLTSLVGHTLTVPLPESICLAVLPQTQRRNEMEFHFAMRPTRVDALLTLLHRFGVAGERQAFGARQRLEGLMTGLIDLTYHHAGRWYVLDYKSNRLPSYDPDALATAMAHSEYTLQALIYTVALHRWLRFRLGANYAYARDFGGVRYLFCRGLDATRDPSPGVHAWRFDPALVEGVDALFAGTDAVENPR